MDRDALVAAFTTELSVAGRKMRRLFDNLIRPRRLTLARARALLLLAHDREWNQRELAEALEIEQPSVVRLLDRMEAAGLIERCAVDGDRRVNRIALSDSGKDQLRDLELIVQQLRSYLLAGITEADIAIAIKVMRAVVRNAEAAPGLYGAGIPLSTEHDR